MGKIFILTPGHVTDKIDRVVNIHESGGIFFFNRQWFRNLNLIDIIIVHYVTRVHIYSTS